MRPPQPARMPHKNQLTLDCKQDAQGKSVDTGDGQKSLVPLEMPQNATMLLLHLQSKSRELAPSPMFSL